MSGGPDGRSGQRGCYWARFFYSPKTSGHPLKLTVKTDIAGQNLPSPRPLAKYQFARDVTLGPCCEHQTERMGWLRTFNIATYCDRACAPDKRGMAWWVGSRPTGNRNIST